MSRALVFSAISGLLAFAPFHLFAQPQLIAVPVVQYPNILRPDVCAQNLCDTGSNFTLKTGSGRLCRKRAIDS